MLFLAVFFATTAFGQMAEFSLHGGVTRLRNSGIGTLTPGTGATPDDVELTNGWRFGFRVTLNNWRFAGHEFGYAYNRTQFRVNTVPVQEVGTSIHQGFYNFLVYATPEGIRVRPFITGGVHFANTAFPGYSVTQGGGSTKFGYNYGGGIKVRVTDLFMLRFDIRDYSNPKPFDFPLKEGWMRLTEFSAGFAVTL
jgi:hypothetical protein